MESKCGGKVERHLSICAYIAVHVCEHLEKALESGTELQPEAVWGKGGGRREVFQTIASECFITRCLHIIHIKKILNRFYLTCHLPKTHFKEFYYLNRKERRRKKNTSLLWAKY